MINDDIDYSGIESHLVLDGNGFDLSHGLKSGYSKYKNWPMISRTDLFEKLNRYIDTPGDWLNKFESNLAEFHVPKLIQDALKCYSRQDSKLPPSPAHPANVFLEE